MTKTATITPQSPIIPEVHAFVLELHRLLACYQLATVEERKLVWGILNKYVNKII